VAVSNEGRDRAAEKARDKDQSNAFRGSKWDCQGLASGLEHNGVQVKAAVQAPDEGRTPRTILRVLLDLTLPVDTKFELTRPIPITDGLE
jgi:hypothetical protein